MIGKCKAIAHGSTALEYIFREGKLGSRFAFHNLCSREPKAIYEEMKVVSDYNTRCRNKFLRIEIGIAPQDERKLPVSELMRIAHLFAKQMGLDNHQWVAVTHKDTDNRHLHIIANRHNLGFGKANNLALKKATGEFILFLNPDTILTEHTLHDCIAFARTRPNLGGLGVKMLRDNGEFALESRRSLPTPWTSFCKITGLATLFPKSKLFGKYNLRFQSEDESSQIDIISGAFLFAKHEVLKKTGGFDEQFFMYGEDIDLSYRILKAGYKNYYLPTPILHYKGESTHKNSFRYVHVFYEAMLIFFRKHYRHYSLLLSIPIMAAIILSACLSLVSRQLRRFKRFL